MKNREIPRLPPKDFNRFVDYCADSDGHLVWTGPLSQDGYPVFYIHREGKTIKLRAHRVYYFIRTGKQPGETLDHLCGFKDCLKHTESVTDEENRRRQNSRKTGAPEQLSFPFDGGVEETDSGNLRGPPEVPKTKVDSSRKGSKPL